VVWLGLGTALLTTLYAVALDQAWKDLRYLYVIPLWVPFSIFMNLVMIWAIILELRGANARWNKLDRTGVVSRKEM
jgi:poly-beta-1,6-N-acetyl-D-glucosamine synthase